MMVEKKEILMGYDNRGIVYDQGDFVLRKILPAYKAELEKTFSLYQEYNLNNLGIVETKKSSLLDDNYLHHTKHLITYPFEWTAHMFKDAVLFHLDLFIEFSKNNITLKDAHPHNILFDSTKPIFIDFFSIVTKETLLNEKSLYDFVDQKKHSLYPDPHFIIFDFMLFPELIIPLILMKHQKYAAARDVLRDKGCNNAAPMASWNDIYQALDGNNHIFKTFFEMFTYKRFFKKIRKLPFLECITQLRDFVSTCNISPSRSIYDDYYTNKKEDFSFENRNNWKDKQKNVCNIIEQTKPTTVLDLGANTGWFSRLSAHLGASVIATDIEESSIDLLYLEAKKNNLKITPLLLPIENTPKEYYGAYDESLAFKEPHKNPIFMAASKRINTDLVLCLALIHHVVLSHGMPLRDFFTLLDKLSKKHLVVEFIGLNDDLIQLHASSFTFHKDTYSQESVIEAGLLFFKDFEIFPSTPSTRTLILFSK